ncbi:hypothetical protein [Veillonella ratti]|nr:hypothetical protein [Veillonella ratti]
MLEIAANIVDFFMNTKDKGLLFVYVGGRGAYYAIYHYNDIIHYNNGHI